MGKSILKDIVSVIDIGTTKICVLIATQDSDGKLDLIGFGQHPSYGLKKGVIVNVTKTVDSLKKAIKQAENMSGIQIDTVAVGISGGHINSLNSTGVVAIKNKDINQDDVDRVVEAAKAVALPQGQEILHVLPQYFKIDGQECILDSIGMHGIRLEAQVHIITGAVCSAQNIIKACEMTGVRVSDIVLEQIASADAVLTPSEKELGVGILDIGGGTSDFAIYRDGRIMHSKVLPIAGNHFTNDLAIGLGIPIEKAEELKKTHGFVFEECFLDLDNDKITIDLEYENKTKNIETYSLYEILNPRAEEIFDLLCDELVKYRLQGFMPSGIVLTGGGSLLLGMQNLAKNKFGMPIRIGVPSCYKSNITPVPDLIKSPVYATGYGLLLYASGQDRLDFIANSDNSAFKKIFKRMKSWIYDFL
ncbi:cell division protein FtsA [Candidatus Dependentiae bacterium]|nr:cell division protein FtsA [Candidatus Dependentiae bacterium]